MTYTLDMLVDELEQANCAEFVDFYSDTFTERQDVIDAVTSFHARNVFMIEKNDEYFLGMRADHFVVEEGFTERPFWSCSMGSEECKNVTCWIVSCNHKGIRRCKFVWESEPK